MKVVKLEKSKVIIGIMMALMFFIPTGQKVNAYDRSYTALDLYVALEENEAVPYTLTDKAIDFISEHDDLFPSSDDLDLPEELIDSELDSKHVNKSPSKYGDRMMVLPLTQVVQIEEEEIEEGSYFTFLNLIDWTGQQYSVFYYGELEDIFEDDSVLVTGLPLGTSSFENGLGGQIPVIVIAGSIVWNMVE